MERITVRLGVQQRVLPAYRIPFFDALAIECMQGMSLFAGQPRREERIESNVIPQTAAYVYARNLYFFRGAFYLCWQKGILDWLKKWKPGALIMETNPRYLSSYAAIRRMKRRNLPILGWGLGSPVRSGVLAAFRATLRRRFINQFDALIAYSRRGAEEFQQLGYPSERIFIAPNATAMRPIHAAPQRPSFFQAEKPVVIFVGRLQARKKVDELIRACASLPADFQPLLHIVGDGPLRSELEKLAEQVYPSTQFTGALHGRELEMQMTKADLFVLPGTGGLAVQQAMAFALPVIVGEADGTQEDLVRAENGWCLTDNDIEELTKTLREALGDITRLRSMGLASYRIVKEEINLENMVQIFIEAVNSVVEKR